MHFQIMSQQNNDTSRTGVVCIEETANLQMWRLSHRCWRCREQKAELAEKLKAKAEELAEQFKADWQPVAENLDRAMKAFDDLEGGSLRSTAARLMTA